MEIIMIQGGSANIVMTRDREMLFFSHGGYLSLAKPHKSNSGDMISEINLTQFCCKISSQNLLLDFSAFVTISSWMVSLFSETFFLFNKFLGQKKCCFIFSVMRRYRTNASYSVSHCTMAKFQWEVRHSEFWTLPLILSASKYFRLISLSLYPHPNISDKFLCHFIFVEDKMNNQPYLFHSRKTKTKRRYGKWKWNYKSDIWPPCSIKKREVKYLLNNFSE